MGRLLDLKRLAFKAYSHSGRGLARERQVALVDHERLCQLDVARDVEDDRSRAARGANPMTKRPIPIVVQIAHMVDVSSTSPFRPASEALGAGKRDHLTLGRRSVGKGDTRNGA